MFSFFRGEEYFAKETAKPRIIPNVLLKEIPLLETVLNLRDEKLTGNILNKTDFNLTQRALTGEDNREEPQFKKYDKVVLKVEVVMDLPLRNFTVVSVDQSGNGSVLLLKHFHPEPHFCEVEAEKVLKAEMKDNDDARIDDSDDSRRDNSDNRRLAANPKNTEKLKEEIWIGTREILKRIESSANDFLFKNTSITFNIDKFKVPYCV